MPVSNDVARRTYLRYFAALAFDAFSGLCPSPRLSSRWAGGAYDDRVCPSWSARISLVPLSVRGSVARAKRVVEMVLSLLASGRGGLFLGGGGGGGWIALMLRPALWGLAASSGGGSGRNSCMLAFNRGFVVGREELDPLFDTSTGMWLFKVNFDSEEDAEENEEDFIGLTGTDFPGKRGTGGTFEGPACGASCGGSGGRNARRDDPLEGPAMEH